MTKWWWYHWYCIFCHKTRRLHKKNVQEKEEEAGEKRDFAKVSLYHASHVTLLFVVFL